MISGGDFSAQPYLLQSSSASRVTARFGIFELCEIELGLPQQLRQLGNVRRDPPHLIARLHQTDLRGQFPA